jgi:hypothetical protein
MIHGKPPGARRSQRGHAATPIRASSQGPRIFTDQTDFDGLMFLSAILSVREDESNFRYQANRKIEDRNIRRQKYSCRQIFLSFHLNEIGELVLKIRATNVSKC